MSKQHMTPIENDFIEISVFGPGFGESIVINVANRYVCQVDCCTPAAEYLHTVYAKYEPRLGFFLLTHPHFDHFQSVDESLTLPFERISRFAGMHVTELQAILGERAKWSTNRKYHHSARSFDIFVNIWESKSKEILQLVGVDTLVARERFIHGDTMIDLEALAIAPTVAAVDNFNNGLRPSLESGRAAYSNDQCNDASVVLVVKYGDAVVLLTGDVSASVLRETESRVPRPLSLLKLAHHGSKRSNSTDLVGSLLENAPEALVVVTPFCVHKLPDVDLMNEIIAGALSGSADRLLSTHGGGRNARVAADWSLFCPEGEVIAEPIDCTNRVVVRFDSSGQRLRE